MAFYSIEYSITSVGGKHSKIQSFNPDFFITLKHKNQPHFIVLEIKANNDASDENKAKNKYAKLHFENLNAELKTKKIKEMYHFHFLSPSSYVVFFDHLRNGKLLEDKFTSELELLLLAEDE